MAAADHTSPFVPIPASVRPRWSGCRVRRASSRYRETSSGGREVLQEMTTLSSARPDSSANSVDWSADSTMHSAITCSEVSPSARSVFSCIFAITSSWLSEPALTPIRTALSLSRATLQMAANCSSRRTPWPTLPGLMRYFASARAQSGNRARRRWPL